MAHDHAAHHDMVSDVCTEHSETLKPNSMPAAPSTVGEPKFQATNSGACLFALGVLGQAEVQQAAAEDGAGGKVLQLEEQGHGVLQQQGRVQGLQLGMRHVGRHLGRPIGAVLDLLARQLRPQHDVVLPGQVEVHQDQDAQLWHEGMEVDLPDWAHAMAWCRCVGHSADSLCDPALH